MMHSSKDDMVEAAESPLGHVGTEQDSGEAKITMRYQEKMKYVRPMGVHITPYKIDTTPSGTSTRTLKSIKEASLWHSRHLSHRYDFLDDLTFWSSDYPEYFLKYLFSNADITHRKFAMLIQRLYSEQLNELIYTSQHIPENKISLEVVHRLSATLDSILTLPSTTFYPDDVPFDSRLRPSLDVGIVTWLQKKGNTLRKLMRKVRRTFGKANTMALDQVLSHEDVDSSADAPCSTDTKEEKIIAYIKAKLFTATPSIPVFPKLTELDTIHYESEVLGMYGNILKTVHRAMWGSSVLFICPSILHHIGLSKAPTRQNVICDVLLISEKIIPILATHLYCKDDNLWSGDHDISNKVCYFLSQYGFTSPDLKHIYVVGFNNLEDIYFSAASKNVQLRSSDTPQINIQVMTQMLHAMASCTYDAHFANYNERLEANNTDLENAFPPIDKIDKNVPDRNQDTSMSQAQTPPPNPTADFCAPMQEEQSIIQHSLLEDRVLSKYRVHRCGGIVDFPNGVQLFVPANAFSVGEHRDILVGTTENGMDQPTLQPGQRRVTPVIIISPHDMVFENPAVLSIPHGQNFKSSEDAIADLVILHSQTEIGFPVRWCRWDNSNTGSPYMFAFMTKDHVILVLTHFCFFTVAIRNCGSVDARSLRILTFLEPIRAMGHSVAKLTVIAVDDDEPHVFEKRFPHLKYGEAVCNQPFVVYNTGMGVHIKIHNILPPWIVQHDTCQEKLWSFIHLWKNLCPNHLFCMECNQELPQLVQCQVTVYQEPDEQGIADEPIVMAIAATIQQPAARISGSAVTDQTMTFKAYSQRDLSSSASDRHVSNDNLLEANSTNNHDDQWQLPPPLQTSFPKPKHKCCPSSPWMDRLPIEMDQQRVTSEHLESPRTDPKPKAGPRVRDLEDDVSLVPASDGSEASLNALELLPEFEPRNNNMIMPQERRNNRPLAPESVQRRQVNMLQRQLEEHLRLGPDSMVLSYIYGNNYKQLCDLFYMLKHREPRNGHIRFSLVNQLAFLLDEKHPLGNDWRMLADNMNLSHAIRHLEQSESPTSLLLIMWQVEKRTLADLKVMMTQMQRVDVVQEIENFEKSKHAAGAQEMAHIPELQDNNDMQQDTVTC